MHLGHAALRYNFAAPHVREVERKSKDSLTLILTSFRETIANRFLALRTKRWTWTLDNFKDTDDQSASRCTISITNITNTRHGRCKAKSIGAL